MMRLSLGTRVLSQLQHRLIFRAFMIFTAAYIPSNVIAFSGSSSKSIFSPMLCPTLSPSPLTFQTRLSSSFPSNQESSMPLKRGDAVQVEVTRFGPLGASVAIIGSSHDPNSLIGENDPAIATGLILQKEIGYFRAARNNLDVVVGEILCAYVENVRDDGKIDVSLRRPGGKGKADEMEKLIMDTLKAKGGQLDVGDKSSPEEINKAFPGTSKATFKRGIAALYKKGKVQPGAFITKII